MYKVLFQKRDERQNPAMSIDYKDSKFKNKSQGKNKKYLLAKIDETYGQIKYKLNYLNFPLLTEENQNREFRFNHRYGDLKKISKKEPNYSYDFKLIKRKDSSKEYSNFNNLSTIKNEFDYKSRNQPNISKYFKNNNSLLNRKSPEIESHLDTLWKNLGVNENYIHNFNSYKNLLINPEEKRIFVSNEIENLEKFQETLINLRKEIDIRENKLGEIKNIFEKINNEEDLFNLRKFLNESNSSIISYLEDSTRVVEYYLLFKEKINQGNSKFNEEIIKTNFGINKYDSNYLLKMKSDTNFINIAKINEFKLNKNILNLLKADPFLSCLYSIIQIPFELKEKIKYCQYYVIQESILESLNKGRKNPQTHIPIDAGASKRKPERSEDKANANDNLTVSYFSSKITEFISLYSEYFEKIPEQQKLIFNLNKDPTKYLEHNYYPKIIICKDKTTNAIKGICIYSVLFKGHEKQPDQIIIEHISSYNQEEMEHIITKILKFIRDKNIIKDISKTGRKLNTEILINLYYHLVNEEFQIDKNIKDFIEKKLKFKLGEVEDISEVLRCQKMKLIITNVNNNNFENNYNLCSNFFIKDNFTVNLVEKLIMNNANNNDFNIKKINPYNIIYIIYLMKKIYNIKNSFDYLLNKLNKFSTKKNLLLEDANNDVAMSLVLNDNFNNDLNIKSLPKDLQSISNCIKGDLNNELDINNNLNIFPLFDGCVTIKYRNYFYNRIECENIKVLKEKATEQIFYQLNTTNDENMNILISSNLNYNFKMKYLSNSNEDTNEHFNNIKNFEEIYNNLEEFISEKKSINNYIYIPSFSIEQKYEQSNVENSNEEVKNVINSFNEEYKVEFLTEELIKKKKKKVSNNFEFNITKEEINKNGYLIEDEFIIFILDNDIMDKIGIIPVISIDVHKNNFISNSNSDMFDS